MNPKLVAEVEALQQKLFDAGVEYLIAYDDGSKIRQLTGGRKPFLSYIAAQLLHMAVG
jgi:hypothetical protein